MGTSRPIARWRTVAFVAAASVVAALIASASAPTPESTSILNSGPDCVPSARYVAPSGVEVGEATDPGIAPADLPGTGFRADPPTEIAFPLFVDPLPPTEAAPVSGEGPGLTPASRAGSSLYVGDVIYNRASGAVEIGGTTVTAPSTTCP